MIFKHTIVILKQEIAEFKYDLRTGNLLNKKEKEEINNEIKELQQAIEILQLIQNEK